MSARMSSRRAGRIPCDRSIALFDELRRLLSPCGFWQADLVASWFEGRMTNLELHPVETDHTVGLRGRGLPLDTVTAHRELREALPALLAELGIPHGQTTIPVRCGGVKELFVSPLLREGEPLPTWAPVAAWKRGP